VRGVSSIAGSPREPGGQWSAERNRRRARSRAIPRSRLDITARELNVLVDELLRDAGWSAPAQAQFTAGRMQARGS
jgi:hypothetical protein